MNENSQEFTWSWSVVLHNAELLQWIDSISIMDFVIKKVSIGELLTTID